MDFYEIIFHNFKNKNLVISHKKQENPITFNTIYQTKTPKTSKKSLLYDEKIESIENNEKIKNVSDEKSYLFSKKISNANTVDNIEENEKIFSNLKSDDFSNVFSLLSLDKSFQYFSLKDIRRRKLEENKKDYRLSRKDIGKTYTPDYKPKVLTTTKYFNTIQKNQASYINQKDLEDFSKKKDKTKINTEPVNIEGIMKKIITLNLNEKYKEKSKDKIDEDFQNFENFENFDKKEFNYAKKMLYLKKIEDLTERTSTERFTSKPHKNILINEISNEDDFFMKKKTLVEKVEQKKEKIKLFEQKINQNEENLENTVKISACEKLRNFILKNTNFFHLPKTKKKLDDIKKEKDRLEKLKRRNSRRFSSGTDLDKQSSISLKTSFSQSPNKNNNKLKSYAIRLGVFRESKSKKSSILPSIENEKKMKLINHVNEINSRMIKTVNKNFFSKEKEKEIKIFESEKLSSKKKWFALNNIQLATSTFNSKKKKEK